MPALTLSKSILLTDLGLCVNRYRTFTPGIYVCFHIPVILDPDTRFVPGLVAQVNHGKLKQCEPTEDGFQGPTNFILDVFGADEVAEYELRRIRFEEFGVTEYVAIFADENQRCDWNRHDGSKFDLVAPDEKGIIKSLALPGLWFSTDHVKDRDWWSLITMVEYGVTRLGHHEFMETIWHKEGRNDEWGDWMPFEAG